MKQLLKNLVALQHVDTKLDAIEMLRGDLPKLVESLKSEVTSLREEIESDKQSIQNFLAERVSLDNDIALHNEKMKKYQEQLYKATSNKEYEATSSQIDFCEQEISRLKTRFTEVELKMMELDEGLKPKEERLKALELDFGEREKELNEKINETAKEESDLKAQRATIATLVRKDVLNKYERIRKAKNGMAVAMVVKDSCGGCFNMIPPQIVIELRKRDMIRTCEFCGRILYSEDESQNADTTTRESARLTT